MWTLRKTFRFEAAHRLPQHDGKCARLHGHSWKGEVAVEGASLGAGGSRAGMVIDYGDIKAVLAPLIDAYLDHHYLNESLRMENPTSEEVARWLYEAVEPYLTGLHSVTIRETCTSACTFERRTDASH